MRHIFYILAAGAAAVALGWWIGHVPGSVSLVFNGVTVETSLPVAIVAAVLTLAALYVGLRLLATIFGLPGAFSRNQEIRARRHGDAAVTAALVALAAQDASAAQKYAQRARKYLGDTAHTLMLTASAHQLAGEKEDELEAWQALSRRKDSAFLGLRGLLRHAMANQDFWRAAELAKAAHEAHPKADWMHAERRDIAARNGEWQEAMRLARDPMLRAAFAAEAAKLARVNDTNAAARKLARAAFKAAPGLTEAALLYARALRDEGRERAAQDVLRAAWGENPHPDLAACALEGTEDKTARLKLAVALTRNAKRSAETLFLLAGLTLVAGEAAEAQNLANAARDAGMEERRLYLLLADIAERSGDVAARQAAAAAAQTAAADPSWQCGNCATLHNEWHAVCPHCHESGRIAWGRA
jgi:HemY protein